MTWKVTTMIYKTKRNSAKKLTEEAVIDIMTDKVSSAKQIAARHGVNPTQIYDIHKGKTWKHISLDPQYTPRNFKAERLILDLDVVSRIKSGEITDFESISKQYGVSVKYLKLLRNPNYIDAWKTVPTTAQFPIKNYRKKLTKKEIISILADDSKADIVAEKYNIHVKTVWNLRAGYRRKEITCDPRYAWKKSA